MKNFLFITAFLFFLYIIKTPFINLLKFICDNFIGKIFERVGEWIKPLSEKIVKARPSIDLYRLMGSIFLFVITLLLCIMNYYLIFYGMELLLPTEENINKIFGLTPAGLASVVMMLVEVALGFLILEVFGLTDLFKFHTFKKSTRIALGIFLLFFFVLLVLGEIVIAVKRVYEVSEENTLTFTRIEKIFKTLPYVATIFITASIPILNALSAFSLRDVLLSILWIALTALYIILFIFNVFYEVILAIITHIDDFLDALIKLLTWPIELLVSGILYLLIKLKILKPVVSILLLALFSHFCFSSQNIETHNKLIVVLMDNSGSFRDYIERALNHCIKYIDAMKAGDAFTLFLIDVDTLSRKEPPISFSLPKSPTTLPTREFRAKIKETKNAKKTEIIELKKRPRAKFTDIAGGISRASTFFSSQQFANYEKYLLMYSDMQDTRGRGIVGEVNLRNVCVKILYADITEKTKAGIEFWVRKLKNFGAKSIQVLTPDDCEVQANFTLKCEN